ncbi:MAG: hypothetical protein ACLGIV_11010 [Actinomycetes bacterium]
MTAVRDADLLLPEGTRLLHIGPQKTGTTAIQFALNRSREQLREHGVVVPGKGPRPLKAVWSLLGTPDGRPQPPIKHWDNLVRQVEEAGDLRVCISTEDWARVDLDGAKQTVAGLGGERAHVVATARRLDKLLPSQWQQRVKMRRITLTYDEWLERVLGDDTSDPHWRNLWVPHDIGSLVDRWTEAAGGRDRFTLIVADEADHGLLPRVFEQLLGLPESILALSETDKKNSSVSLGRADMIRRINLLAETKGWPDAYTTGPVRLGLTQLVKDAAAWPEEIKSPPLPGWAAERLRELSDRRAELVAGLDIRVVGDPDNLRVPEGTSLEGTPVGTIMVSAELAADAVELAIDGALEEQRALLDERDRQIARLRNRVERLRKRANRADRSAPGLEGVSGRELVRELGRRAGRRAGLRSRR